MLKKYKGAGRQLKWKKVPMLMLAVMLACFMAGCRQSPILEQVIYTKDAVEIDPQQEQLDPEDDGEETEDFRNKITEDAQRERDQESSAAVFDEIAASAGVAQSVMYSPYGSSDLSAKGGNGEDGNGGDGGSREGLDEIGEADGQDDGNQNDEDGESEDEPLEEDGGDPSVPDENPSDGNADKDSVTDDDGEQKDVPEGAALAAAAGIGAEIVEMVAGSGHLAASSESFVNNPIASAIFPDVASGSVKAVWSGSGAAPIADVNSLLSIEGLNMCFYVTGQSFTGEQIAQLEASGISCTPLPAIDSAETLKEAVMVVAEAFKQETGGASVQVAQNYAVFTDTAMSSVSAGDFIRYSVYLSDWRPDISYTFQRGNFSALPIDNGGTGSGVAVAWSAEKAELISTFMGCAGVINQSGQYSADGREGFYVTPMFHQFTPSFSDDSYGYYATNIGEGYDAFVTVNNANNLGDAFFPAVIVKNDEIREAIGGADGVPDGADGGNWYWQYHGGADNGIVRLPGGYYNPAADAMFYGSIVGTYQIFVNPSGVGDWAEGSLESPLEAYWVAAKFGNGTTSWDVLQGKVLEFYNQFYGVDASGLLSTILKE